MEQTKTLTDLAYRLVVEIERLIYQYDEALPRPIQRAAIDLSKALDERYAPSMPPDWERVPDRNRKQKA